MWQEREMAQYSQRGEFSSFAPIQFYLTLFLFQNMVNITINSFAKPNFVQFTVIDTPGFGEKLEDEANILKDLVNKLKHDFKSINTFMILFKDSDSRETYSFMRMVSMLSEMFGDDFWNNVVIGVTFWKYDERSINERKTRRVTEQTFLADKRKGLKDAAMEKADKESTIGEIIDKLEGVFINAFYDTEPIDKNAAEKFQSNTDKLFQIATENKLFECKDIQTVKNELAVLKELKQNLTRDMDLLKEKRDDLAEQSADANGKLTECREKQKEISEDCDNGQKAAQAGLGVGMFAVGLLVGALLVVWFKFFRNSRVSVTLRLMLHFLPHVPLVPY